MYYSEAFDENNAILFFNPPLERINNFKFKFRYHDGRLIDIASIRQAEVLVQKAKLIEEN